MSEVFLWVSVFGVCWAPLFPAFYVGQEEDLHKKIRELLQTNGIFKRTFGHLLQLFFGVTQRWVFFVISLLYITVYFLKG